MSSNKYIKSAVKLHQQNCVHNSPNRNWVIGLTYNIDRRYKEHKYNIRHEPRFLWYWSCESHNDALYLEKYFKSKGYNAELGGVNQDSIILYMYYLPQNKDSKRKN